MLGREDFFDEDLEILFPGITTSKQGVNDTINEFFPVDQLSQTERAELAGLQSRAQRLAPIQPLPGVGSSAIPGNPFSTNNSPIINNFLSALTNTFNAIRQRRLTRPDEQGRILQEGADQVRARARELPEGDPRRQQLLTQAAQVDRLAEGTSPLARLQTLQNRAQQAQSQRELRGEALSDIVPGLIEQAAEVRGRLAENRQKAKQDAKLKEIDFKFDSALLTQEGTQRLTELGKELDNEIAVIREKAKTDGDGSGGSGVVSAGDINNLRQTVNSMVQEINREIELANQTIVDPDQLEKRISALRKQKRSLISEVFETAGATAGLTQQQIQDLISDFNNSSDDPATPQPGADSTSVKVSFEDLLRGGN